MPSQTERGTPCPDCDGKEDTLYVAPVANAKGDRYAVGLNCYRKHWEKVYPDTPCEV